MAIQSGKGYSAGSFVLEVDGTFATMLDSVEGGSPYGAVVASPPGTDGVVRKQLGAVAYGDIVLTCGVPEGDWGQWIKGFLEGKAPQHDGAVVFLNYNYVAIRRLEFRHATIASVTFPRLDAGGSKESALLTVALRVESTRDAAPSGAPPPSTKGRPQWRASNFVVDLPGIDCKHVSSVAALTVSQPLDEDDVGSTRVPTRSPGPRQVGDLVLTVSLIGAAGFTSWRDDFIVNGNNGSAQEKTGTVTYKSVNLKDDLFSLVLRGVGMHRLDDAKQVVGNSSFAKIVASMYCEEAAVSLPEPAGPAAPDPPAAPGRGDPVTGGRSRVGDLAEHLDPADVARRLESSAEKDAAGAEDGQRQRGARLGAAWAQRMASLDELAQVAALVRGDWTAIALDDGHTLVEALLESGVVPTAHSGDLELSRDSFVEGVVEGATDIYDEVRVHLKDPEGPRA